MQQPNSNFSTRLLAVGIATALSATAGFAQPGSAACDHAEPASRLEHCRDKGDEHPSNPHDDHRNEGFTGNPKTFKIRLPTAVPGASAQLEFAHRLSRQAFAAKVKVPIQSASSANLDDLAAAEDATVSLELYRAGATTPYANCDLDLAAIKFKSFGKTAEYAVKMDSRQGLAPRVRQGFCSAPGALATASPIIPEVTYGDAITLAITVGGLPPVRLIDQSPIF
jgi:hypothetical protein